MKNKMKQKYFFDIGKIFDDNLVVDLTASKEEV